MVKPEMAQELMLREIDRNLRVSTGIGIDEIPPAMDAEYRARSKAIRAAEAYRYAGRQRPTYTQCRAIQEYNVIASRYRALAEAELSMKTGAIEREIAAEREAGTYSKPGASSSGAFWGIAAVVAGLSAAGMALDDYWGFWGWWIALTLLLALLAFGGFVAREPDPRIAAARAECRGICAYWRPLT